jgi:hypothetical protein
MDKAQLRLLNVRAREVHLSLCITGEERTYRHPLRPNVHRLAPYLPDLHARHGEDS